MNSQRQDRLRARFDQLDADGSGYVESVDFDLAAKRLLEAFGETESTGKGRDIVNSHRTYWERMAEQLDANKDGRISFDEFCKVVGRADQFDPVVRPYANAVVGLADRDDDGYVEKDDFVRCLEAMDFPRDGISSVHSSLSAGERQGRVGADTWTDFIVGFYTADDDHPAQALVSGR